jgi:predicted aminopeptidase
MKFIIFSTLFFFSSCGMLGYLSEQGIGQMRLQWKGVQNETILKDPKISQEMKRKILLVEEYKKFFFNYLGKKASGIYSKTTILDQKAVTYLVIASSHTKLEAHEFKFPIMGSFPYLGFFNKETAKKFARKLEENENLVTWIRPVFAYSTLGYLEDRILSSFFEFDDVELAELVFHELFHTVFFIKDEIDLNENLANYFGKEMLKEYFKDREELKDYLAMLKKKSLIDQRIVELISILQTEFDKLGPFITPEKADELTARFVQEVFKPDLKSLCFKILLPESECELKENWNQATFAAFLTYEEDQNFLNDLMASRNLTLKKFLNWLKLEYVSFTPSEKVATFTDYLKEKVSHAPLAAD